MSDLVLQAAGIVKRFGGLTAVDNVNFDLRPHEIHAVIGPNGAGKTTFLATLAGDHAPTGGRVFVNGIDITHLPVRSRTRLGVGRTYQHSAVIGGFTALDMVRLAALARTGSWGDYLATLAASHRATTIARDALKRVALESRENAVTDALSHGEKRRLEIAAVLALDPNILLLDEPLAGLGPDESHAVVDLVRDLKGHCSIVLIEHDIDVVFAIADRITVLDNGRVIASGLPNDVRDNADVQRAYLGLEDD
jgi:branched-chain amino acid transport system ATP-binding protein